MLAVHTLSNNLGIYIKNNDYFTKNVSVIILIDSIHQLQL